MTSWPAVLLLLAVLLWCRRDDGGFSIDRTLKFAVVAACLLILSPAILAWLGV